MKNSLSFVKNRQNYLGTTLLSLTIFASSIALFTPSSQAEVKKARSTEAFIDSVGVVVKLWDNQSSYSQYDKVVKPRLKELGVRHIRTNVRPGDRKTIAKMQELAEMGFKFNLVMDPRKLSLTETIRLVETFGKSVQSVEGPNEWNHSLTKTYKGKSFPEGLKNYQSDLYRAIKNNPDTAHVPVIAPSLSHGVGLKKSVEQLGKVTCDINNAHNYPAGQMPASKHFFWHLPYLKEVCGSDKPLISTETGYTNALKTRYGVSETAAARYLPRLLMTFFNNGFKRTYIYQLMNDYHNPSLDITSHNFGFLRADGTKKKSFIAIRNLLDILDNSDVETATKRVPLGSLDYYIKGDTTNIHQTLLQKKDGRFYLVLWQEVNSYNLKTKSDIKVPYRHLNIFLDTKISRAKIYKPNWKKGAVKIINNPRRLKVGVADRLLIIELKPNKK
ncbi:hypothetical protein [Myxosarcina sp. GI1(2024)]